jgi:hypothetical protein
VPLKALRQRPEERDETVETEGLESSPVFAPRIAVALVASLCLASSAVAGTLVWETEFLDDAAISGASVTTADVQVDISTIVFSDNDSGGSDLSPFGSNTLFFKAEHGTTGNHAGYGFLGFNNLDDDPADYLEVTFLFSLPVEQLAFSLLDLDQRAQGGSSDFSDGVVVTYNGGTNVIVNPAFYTLGPNVIVGDEGFGEFEGLAHGDGDASGNSSTDGNIDFSFGSTAISSLTIRYFSTDDAPADPSGQLLGVSDLNWVVPEPATGVLLATGMLFLAMQRRRRGA